MNNKNNKNLKNKLIQRGRIVEISIGIFLILLFILISYLVQNNLMFFENNLNFGFWGIIIYIVISSFITMLVPISAIPLLPIAVALWGEIPAAIFSLISWTIGSTLAFILARRFGVKIVAKFIKLENITKYEKLIPKSQFFLSIVLIRLFLPVDILSYLLGIFSRVSLRTYVFATIIGLIPFAIILSYLGTLPILYQIISFVVGGIFLFFIGRYFKRKYFN